MAKQITSVTEAGFKKLKDELDYLKNVKRREALLQQSLRPGGIDRRHHVPLLM